IDVALLIDRLRRDLGGAVAPDDVLEDRRRALVLLERARDRLDRPRRKLVALSDQLRQLADHRLRGFDGLGGAVERQHVAAQEHGAVELALERLEDRVAGAGQLRCRRVVKFDLVSHAGLCCSVSRASRTAADARLPSTSPPARSMTTLIT